MNIKAPTNEQELTSRAQAIAGMTLGELAQQLNIQTPENLLHNKGWGGQLLELALGATAKSLPIPDFPELGIELKSIPIGYDGQPLETTFVCVAPLTNTLGLTWEKSGVYSKMKRVLWVPILSEREIPVQDRVIGNARLWSPSVQQAQLMQADWEEIMERITLGDIQSLNAKLGQVLQLRPKAANSSVKTKAVGKHGEEIQALPRGYYLKKSFTRQILDYTAS